MKKKGIWFALLVGTAVIVAEMALSHAKVLKQLEREQTGSAGYEEELLLSAGQLLEDYPYSINVQPQKLTEKKAKEFLKQAEAEIDATFYMEGETADYVTLDVQPQKSYQNGMVEAEWYFDNYEVINEEGVLNEDQLNEDALNKKEGVLLCATVMLSCEEYEEDADSKHKLKKLQSLASGYKAWIEEIEEESKKLDKQYTDAARRHIKIISGSAVYACIYFDMCL